MLRSLIAVVWMLVWVASAGAATPSERYAELAQNRLNAAHEAAVELQHAVTTLLSEPNDATLESARLAWRHAHNMLVMARPLSSGGGNSERPGAAADFAEAEYILWGNDDKLDAPGNRPLSDFIGDEPQAVGRRMQLTNLMDVIVKRAADRSSRQPQAESATAILNQLAATANRVAEMNIEKPLASGDAQHESSRYSDNSLEDLRHIIQGMQQVVAVLQPDSAKRMAELLDRAAETSRGIHAHMDYLIAAPADHPERRALERIAADLRAFAKEAASGGSGDGDISPRL